MLGMMGMAYTMGASALWAAVGYTSAECLLFLFFAPRIRRFAEAYDCTTLPDVFAAVSRISLVMASTVVRDVYQQILRKDEDLDERHLVVPSRLVVAVVVSRFTRPPEGVEEMFRVMEGGPAGVEVPGTAIGRAPSERSPT